MINFYPRFLRNTAQVLAPLTTARKGPGKSLLWSPELNFAFIITKKLLASQFLCSTTLNLVLLSPWLLTPLIPTLALFFNRSSKVPGLLWLSSPTSFLPPSPNTPPSTESSWLLTLLFFISVFYWRGDSLPCSRITSF